MFNAYDVGNNWYIALAMNEYYREIKAASIYISVLHFFVEQISHGKLYKNMKDCVLSHTFLKISIKNSI